MAHRVTFIPGDGTGPEISEATQRVLEATGVEYEEGKDETLKLRDFIEETEGTKLRDDIGVTIKAISITGTQRIVREAFEYAKAYGRKKVTAVHKANIMKFTDGLFLRTAN